MTVDDTLARLTIIRKDHVGGQSLMVIYYEDIARVTWNYPATYSKSFKTRKNTVASIQDNFTRKVRENHHAKKDRA